MHPEIKESLKLSDKGSYYKQEDFYYSTDESNEDTNSNSERVLSASSTKAFLWSSKLRWQCLLLGTFDIFFFLYLMILFSIFFYYLSKFSKFFPSDQSISIQGCYTIVTC
jgi:hypothetical protein